MTKDGISRRQVLRAASVAGGLGIASGVGTQSLLGDEESFLGGRFGGGTLDLEVTHEDLTGTNPCEWDPSIGGEPSDDRVSFAGGSQGRNWGVHGIALTVCDNPGLVTVALERNETAGELNDQSSPDLDERSDSTSSTSKKGPKKSGKAQQSGKSQNGRSMGGGSGGQSDSPADEPYVELRAGSCKGTLLAEGSLSSVVASLEDGKLLKTGCTYLGKLEAHNEGKSFTAEDGTDDGEDRFVFDHEGESVTVEITDREHKDGGKEVKGVDLAVDGAKLCRVMVKGGAGYETVSPECEATVSVAAGDNHGGQQSAISHLKLFVCGDEDPCIPCAPEDPFKLFLTWTGGREETNLDLVFSAEQCRHAGDGGSQ